MAFFCFANLYTTAILRTMINFPLFSMPHGRKFNRNAAPVVVYATDFRDLKDEMCKTEEWLIEASTRLKDMDFVMLQFSTCPPLGKSQNSNLHTWKVSKFKFAQLESLKIQIYAL